MLDIDHFKQVNDIYGHAAGDEVLQKVAKILMDVTRGGDLSVRFGGEEFITFAIGQSLKNSVVLAEKLRNSINTITFEGVLQNLTITISAGVAERYQNESFTDLIKRVDLALYQAKNTGRTKVCVAEQQFLLLV